MKIQPMKHATWAAIACLVMACGGSDASYSTTVKFAEKTLTATGAVTLATGSIVIPDKPLPCLSLVLVTGTLAADAPPFPGSVQVVSATVYAGETPVWDGEIDHRDTWTDDEGAIRVVARGCAPAGLVEGQPVFVVFRLESAGEVKRLASGRTDVAVVF